MSEEEKHAIEFFNKVIYQIGEEDIMKNNCILLSLIDKLQKENEKLQIRIKTSQNFAKIVEKDYIDKDEIKQLVGYEENEDISKDEIISLLKTMWEEFNRLEDIEDYMETQCVRKNIIRNKIKELEEVKQKEEKENKDEFGINSNTWAIADWGIEVLKELLGE